MDLDIQNFGDYSVKPTFANDADYSNFIFPFAYAGVAYYANKKNKKNKQKRDAQLQADLERAKAQEAENRAKYAKTMEDRIKAENDKKIALEKENKANIEAQKADKDLKQIEKEEVTQTSTPQTPQSNTKKYLIYGGIGLVVVVGLVVLLKRK